MEGETVAGGVEGEKVGGDWRLVEGEFSESDDSLVQDWSLMSCRVPVAGGRKLVEGVFSVTGDSGRVESIATCRAGETEEKCPMRVSVECGSDSGL